MSDALQRTGDGRQRVRVMEAVVGVEEPDRVAAEAAKPLVHGVVEAAVGLGDHRHAVAGKRAHDAQRVVARGPVDDQQLLVGMRLAAERLQRLADGGGGVAADGDDGDAQLGLSTGLAARSTTLPHFG